MRDVNGSPFYLIADAADFTAFAGTEWDADCRVLTLSRRAARMLPARDVAAARAARKSTPHLVRDAAGRLGRISTDGLRIEVQEADGSWAAIVDRAGNPVKPRAGTFVGMGLGGGYRLALIAADAGACWLHLFDLRNRIPLDAADNPPLPVDADPDATDVAVAGDGVVAVLGRTAVLVARGGPAEAAFERPTDRFGPESSNPHPLTLIGIEPTRPGFAPVAIAAGAGRFAALVESAVGAQCVSVIDRLAGTRHDYDLPSTLPAFNDLAYLDANQVALAAPSGDPSFRDRDLLVAALSPGAGLVLSGDRYPRSGPGPARFADSADGSAWYVSPEGARPVLRLPHPGFLAGGAALRSGLREGDPDTVWHRAYAEAALPPGAALTLWARAGGAPAILAGDPPEVAEALLAALLGASAAGATVCDGVPNPADPAFVPVVAALNGRLAAAPFHKQPPLAACSQASELPFHTGFGGGALYETLLQRTRGENRRLQGGMLDLAFVLTGDGRHSPAVSACRVYAPRFSYHEQYLPKLFRQTSGSNEADTTDRALAPDFRERMLASLEGILTPLEGTVAAAEWLLDPEATPVDKLPWLASFLGNTVDTSWPEARQRRSISAAGALLRSRGTYGGVCLALDVATDGGVQRGEVVVVENYRLRRTMATILGIPMDDSNNPLTLDGRVSGNSIVGDTLILADDVAREFLALFAPGVATTNEKAAVQEFFDRYAFRVTVLLHGAARRFQALVKRTMQREMPAHIGWDVFGTDHSFVLGLGPLLGVDTFLDPPAPPRPVTLDVSVLTRDAVIHDAGTLAGAV